MLNIFILAVFFLIISLLVRDVETEIQFMSKSYTSILKGIAILLVLINHIGQSYDIRFVEPLGGIGVCIFLIISGYGLNESFKKKGRENFFKNRFIRVLIPYWIIVVCITIISFFTEINISKVFSYLLLLEIPTGIYWYLRFIICWYVFFYVTSFIKNRKVRIYSILTIAVIFTIITRDNVLFIWQVVSFPIGLILSEYMSTFKNFNFKKYIIRITFISFLISVLSMAGKMIPYVDNNSMGVVDTTLQIILILSATSFVFATVYILKNLRMWKITKYFGELSYELYLIHPLFLSMLIKDSSVTILLLFLIVVVLLSIILNKIQNIKLGLGFNLKKTLNKNI